MADTRRRFVAVGGALAGVVAIGGASDIAATYKPEVAQPTTKMGAGMSKVLVVYGTGSGCTAGVAERIGKHLAEKGATVEVVSAKEKPDAGSFDAVVVGSGIRAGNWHAPVKQWVTAEAAALKGMPVAFYTVCLTMAQDPSKAEEVRAYTDPLIAETGVDPVDVGLFAGWNTGTGFNFLERTILNAMKAPKGDFRDWTAIDAWADSVAPRLLA
jgi:menaquinone-dependent protoporphyrinogen oxidase